MESSTKTQKATKKPTKKSKKRKKKIRIRRLKRFVFVMVYLLLVGMLDYPYLSRIINDSIQGSVAAEYKQVKLTDEETLKMWKDAEAYNRKLLSGNESYQLMDAFATGEESKEEETDTEYESLLSVDGGVMGTIKIPVIDVELPIYHGTTEDSLQKGAGHLHGSSLPVGGMGTHTIISAHRGLKGKTMFTNLDMVKEGDVFFLEILGKTLVYQVYSIETVLPEDISSLDIDPGEDLCTLVTCTPYGVNNHRLLVHAKRTQINEDDEKELSAIIPDKEVLLKEYWWIPVTVLFLIAMLFSLRKIK